MLRWRLTIGALLIAALAGLCWLDATAARPGIALAGLAIVAAVLAVGEMRRMFRSSGVEPSAAAMYVGTLLPVVASAVPIVFPGVTVIPALGTTGWLAIGLALGGMSALASEMRRYATPGVSIANVAHAALSVLYVGGLVGMLVQLRQVNAPSDIGGWRGLYPLLAVIATVKLSDTCQYFVGRSLGKHKLSPLISPGKTWEGAVGGILLASLFSAAAIAWINQGAVGLRPGYFAMAWCFALSVSVAGIIGDLAESLLKRDAGVKDSSDWLPGFGGVLDLLDSLLFAAPVGYLWWVLGLLNP
jgi:phosphatidate cytidylyltransferase